MASLVAQGDDSMAVADEARGVGAVKLLDGGSFSASRTGRGIVGCALLVSLLVIIDAPCRLENA